MARKPTKTDAATGVVAGNEPSEARDVVAAAVEAEAPVVTKPARKTPAKARPAPKKPVPEDVEDEDDEEDEEEDEEEDDEEVVPVYTAKEAVGAFSGLFRFVWPYLKKYPKWMVLVLAGILIETAFNVAFPMSLKFLIDDVLQSDNDNAYKTLVWLISVLAVGGVIVSIITVYYEYIDSLIVSHTMADIRGRLFEHLQTLSAGFYSRTKIGTITSRYGSDMAAVDEAMTHLATWGLLPLFELVAGVMLMFYLNWQLALIALILIPVAFLGPRLLSGRAVDASYQERRAAAGLFGVVQENISAQNVVKAFSLRGISIGWFRERNMIERHYAVRSRFINALVERSVTISVMVLHLIVFGIGAYLTYNEEITLGTFITFESVFWELSYNIGHVTQFIPVSITASAATKHIDDIFNEPARSQDPPDAPPVPRIQRAVTFTNVNFSYGGNERQIDGFNLIVPAGSRVAIVGPSGSGKSTVLNLLMRLYDPQSGSIRIDDTEITVSSRDSLRAQTGIVFQENVLFDISIRENIRLGNPGATDADVERAAKSAEIHRFIRSLPQGYDTVVGERGNMMSGGQRQRVAIARAIVRDPAILLLDEATSALDHGTEQAINKTLAKVAAGRTTICVTHRLHSVTDMDTIFVMDKGRVAESGTHRQLLSQKGIYSDLWKQAG